MKIVLIVARKGRVHLVSAAAVLDSAIINLKIKFLAQICVTCLQLRSSRNHLTCAQTSGLFSCRIA